MKTNVDYQIVAAIIMQYETIDALARALSVVKGVEPKYNSSIRND